ncbi:MAG: hypothetical protein AAGB25_05180 [Pseudomonadota bacterium]
MACFLLRFEIVGAEFHADAQIPLTLDGVEQLVQPAGAFATRAERGDTLEEARAKAMAALRVELQDLRLWSAFDLVPDGVTELAFFKFLFENPPSGFAFYMN